MIFILLGSLPFIAYIKFISGNKMIFFNDIKPKWDIVTYTSIIDGYLKLNEIDK